jgi:NCS1 family nucleobase:cation symporter-1
VVLAADDPQRARRTKYGVSFPVLCRASFGVRGANLPRTCARSSRAAGSASRPGSAASRSTRCFWRWPGWAGVPPRVDRVCDLLAGAGGHHHPGLEGIKKLEGWSAPLLLAGGALLLGWAIVRGGGLGHILSESTRLQTAHVPFWQLFPRRSRPMSATGRR